MKRLIALLLLSICAGHAADAQIDPRPVLYVWSADWCVRCKPFWRDLDDPATGLRTALEARLKIMVVDFDANRPQALLANIHSLPMFICQGRRIVGYTTPEDLVQRLGLPPIQKRAPPAAVQPEGKPQPAAMSTDVVRVLNELNTRLQELERADTPAKLADLQLIAGNLTELVDRIAQHLAEDRKAADELRGQVHEVQQHLAADRAAAEAMLERVEAEIAETATPAPTPVVAASVPWLQKLITFGGALGVIPGGLATGGLGGLALSGAFWLAGRWWNRRRQPSAAAADRIVIERPVPVTVETPPASKVVTEQRYVPVERDTFREATQYAHRELLTKYPGAHGTVDFLNSVVDQYMKQVGASTSNQGS